MRILGIIDDADSLIGTHVAEHYLLTDAAHLDTWLVNGVAHLLNTIAGEVTAGASRVAHCHGKVAILIAIERYLSPFLWVIRHVFLTVRCWFSCHRVAIYAEYREVAGLARPHPVVGLTAKLTH